MLISIVAEQNEEDEGVVKADQNSIETILDERPQRGLQQGEQKLEFEKQPEKVNQLEADQKETE